LSAPSSSPLTGFHRGSSPKQGPRVADGGGEADAGAGGADADVGEAGRARLRTAGARSRTAAAWEDTLLGKSLLLAHYS
jgi:hypothetical protein